MTPTHAAATTPISLSIDAAASVSISYDFLIGGPRITATEHQQMFAAGAPATLSANAVARAERLGDVVQARSSNQATWDSFTRGRFAFADDWQLALTYPTNLNETAQFGFHPAGFADWTYNFIATDSGYITFDYEVDSSGQTFGIGGWNLTVKKKGTLGRSVIPLSSLIPYDSPSGKVVTTSGSYAFPLLKGGNYTVSLENEAGIGVGGGSGARSAATSGWFNWSIAAIPEPSTWVFMMLGFATVGVVRRGLLRGAAS